jgi:hypothetical protein
VLLPRAGPAMNRHPSDRSSRHLGLVKISVATTEDHRLAAPPTGNIPSLSALFLRRILSHQYVCQNKNDKAAASVVCQSAWNLVIQSDTRPGSFLVLDPMWKRQNLKLFEPAKPHILMPKCMIIIITEQTRLSLPFGRIHYLRPWQTPPRRLIC